MSEAKAASCDFVGWRAIRSEVSKRSSEPRIARVRIMQHRAASNPAFDQVSAGDGAGMVGAFGDGWARAGARFEAELIRD